MRSGLECSLLCLHSHLCEGVCAFIIKVLLHNSGDFHTLRSAPEDDRLSLRVEATFCHEGAPEDGHLLACHLAGLREEHASFKRPRLVVGAIDLLQRSTHWVSLECRGLM